RRVGGLSLYPDGDDGGLQPGQEFALHASVPCGYRGRLGRRLRQRMSSGGAALGAWGVPVGRGPSFVSCPLGLVPALPPVLRGSPGRDHGRGPRSARTERHRQSRRERGRLKAGSWTGHLLRSSSARAPGPEPARTRKPPAMVMFFMKLIICI